MTARRIIARHSFAERVPLFPVSQSASLRLLFPSFWARKPLSFLAIWRFFDVSLQQIAPLVFFSSIPLRVDVDEALLLHFPSFCYQPKPRPL